MMKKTLLLACIAGISYSAWSQPLFTYGTKQVSKQEFLKAFNKNPSPSADQKQAIQEYLDLYVNYKLKVQAAYDEKLNEQPSFKYESENFKKQIADNLINEEASINALVDEAFKRSQKDIHAAQIFIEVKAGADTVEAYKQIQAAYAALKAGKDFSETVINFTNDDATKATKGDLGYITVFTLPYEFENEIYKLKPGTFSAPYRSKIGFHIFKNVSERPAVGKRKVSQILITVPKGANEVQQQRFAKIADSVYTELTEHNAVFEKLVPVFSTDRSSLYNGGQLPEVSVGQFDADFEQKVFALKTVGSISKPFQSAYGWHILKLNEVIAVPSDPADALYAAQLKQYIERDNRLVVAKKQLTKKWMVLCKFKEAPFDMKDLGVFTDSAIVNKEFTSYKKITPTTLLFSFEKQKVTAGDWARFVKAIKQSGNPIGSKPYPEMMKEYQQIVCSEYYHDHLEDFNSSMKEQGKEFDEANLLFAAMDKHVWGKAGEDTAGLREYYTSHAAKYIWQPGVSALVITCAGKDLAREVADKLSKNPADWRAITGGYGTNVIADSSRYEQNQLPVKETVEARKGFMSAPEKNAGDDSYTILYVTEVYNKPEQRSFDDARGLVINDYQQVLEKNWLTALKKQYPVKVNQTVLKSLK